MVKRYVALGWYRVSWNSERHAVATLHSTAIPVGRGTAETCGCGDNRKQLHEASDPWPLGFRDI